MDDTKTITFILPAEAEITGWLKTHRPSLVIRCSEKKTSAYVITGGSSSVEYGETERHTVRIRFDDGAASRQMWSDSTDDTALFSPQPVPFAKQVAKAKRLRFEFTPFNASPALVEFDVQGFDERIGAVAGQCGWKP